MKQIFLKRMVTVALLMAIQIVLSRFLAIPSQLIKISLDFLPMAIVAMLYGPVWSSLAWGFCDLIGALLVPMGAYYFGFTLSALVNGLFFGIFLYQSDNKFVRVIAAILLPSLFVTLGLDTVWLHQLYGNPVPVILASRLTKVAVMIPIELLLILLVGRVLNEYIRKNNTIAVEKQQLRREAQRYYNGDFLGEREQISAAILKNITETDAYHDATTVFCYVGRPNEVDTAPIIHRAWADGKTVVTPLCERMPVMTARRVNSIDELFPGRMSILEPSMKCPMVMPDEIDLALVPLLMCDKRGFRIGHGGGYYDHFLANGNKIVKMAVCPEMMYRERLPHTSNDVRMDFVASENTIYKMGHDTDRGESRNILSKN